MIAIVINKLTETREKLIHGIYIIKYLLNT